MLKYRISKNKSALGKKKKDNLTKHIEKTHENNTKQTKKKMNKIRKLKQTKQR